MNVLSVGYPLFPVSSDASGGSEQILAYMDRELVNLGHTSYVLAAAGSRVNGMLLPTSAPQSGLLPEDRQMAQAEHKNRLQRLLHRTSVDLIHFHGLDFHTYLPETQVPMLATLHLPLSWYPPSVFALEGVQFNCVSHSEAAGRDLPVVTNGIDTDFYRPEGTKSDYLLWLGRICPEKQTHVAVEVACRLNLPLVVAGPVHPFPTHLEYFESQVKPRLDNKRIHIGPVERSEKRRLLSEARCLLVTSSVAETSSLVSMEALSCGTPVIANRSGALPEVVEHGVTGYVTDSVDEMVDAVCRIREIESAKCRAQALHRFDSSRMAREYLALYRTVIRQHVAPVAT